MIERILGDYRKACGFGAFCLRYFNASGADASGGIGELRDNENSSHSSREMAHDILVREEILR